MRATQPSDNRWTNTIRINTTVGGNNTYFFDVGVKPIICRRVRQIVFLIFLFTSMIIIIYCYFPKPECHSLTTSTKPL